MRKTAKVEPSKPYRTKTGRVLTDADIEMLATEVERDCDVESLKKHVGEAVRRWDQRPPRLYPSDSAPR